MMFVCSDHFLTNGGISLLRQLYSKNTVLFNVTISGNDAFLPCATFVENWSNRLSGVQIP